MPEPTSNTPSSAGASQRGPVLFSCCPICEKGPVRKKGSAEDEELYACDTCDSDLRETIFGFRYVRLDPKFEKGKSEFLGQTFTKVDLAAACEQLKKGVMAGAAKPSPAEAPAEKPGAKPAEQELWWTLDEEEVARRKQTVSARKDLTVEDLLSEVKQKQSDKKPSEKK